MRKMPPLALPGLRFIAPSGRRRSLPLPRQMKNSTLSGAKSRAWPALTVLLLVRALGSVGPSRAPRATSAVTPVAPAAPSPPPPSPPPSFSWTMSSRTSTSSKNPRRISAALRLKSF
ncbi:hypothetical protein FOCG_16764 [Fusarium oxysporum f. sp. radicis-lycopersici 26381]|nr:hypothetical protein FOCG_16764 [Fusarium oxysporum f. sp. radicis-lycopersici 26381]